MQWEMLNCSNREEEAEGKGLQVGGKGVAVVAAPKKSLPWPDAVRPCPVWIWVIQKSFCICEGALFLHPTMFEGECTKDTAVTWEGNSAISFYISCYWQKCDGG